MKLKEIIQFNVAASLADQPLEKLKWSYIRSSATLFILLPVVILLSENLLEKSKPTFYSSLLIILAIMMILSVYLPKFTRSLRGAILINCFVPQIILISGMFGENATLSPPMFLLMFFPVATALLLSFSWGVVSVLVNLVAYGTLFYSRSMFPVLMVSDIFTGLGFRILLSVAVASALSLYLVRLFEAASTEIKEMILHQQQRSKAVYNRMNLALKATSSVVWEWDFVSAEILLDLKWQSLLGVQYSKEDRVQYRHFLSLLTKTERRRLFAALKKCLARNDKRFKHRLKVVNEEGREYDLKIEGSTLSDSDGLQTRMVGWIKDRSYEAELRQSLIKKETLAMQSAKMATLGEMASGIAHEINNPLAIIHGQAEKMIIKGQYGKLAVSDCIRSANEIAKTSQRISAIVRGLRTFARDGSEDSFVRVSVQEMIDRTLALCSEKFKVHGVLLDKKINIENEEIFCREVQVSQVLLNLLNNAFHAVETMENPWILIAVEDSQDFIEIRVTDSGRGISPEIVDKIFNPFFTSKAVDRGTGLGLSISKGLISAHKGRIYFDEKQKNTCFVVVLPRNPDHVEKGQAA